MYIMWECIKKEFSCSSEVEENMSLSFMDVGHWGESLIKTETQAVKPDEEQINWS